MFNRKKYKKYACVQLKKRWTIPVLAAIIYYAVGALINVPEFYSMATSSSFINESVEAVMDFISIIELCIILIITYAQTNLHLKMSRGPEKVSFADFLEGFSRFGRAILCGFWEMLWTFLWFCLFIIPGFAKHYSYCMTKFVALEYPNISVFKALRISIEITRGHKMDIFMTDLSFLGWFILGGITAGIGFFWIQPYYIMTMTNVYHALLTEAIETKRLKPEDLTED